MLLRILSGFLFAGMSICVKVTKRTTTASHQVGDY